jgi:segregation and condensation protein B
MFGSWLRRLLQTSLEIRLSAPAMETLAVVAYRQPILRAEIEAIRGVQCGDLLRQLLDRDLIRISGRAEDLGRPLVYGTTKRFLQVFGLRHLDELPRAQQLRRTEQSDNVAELRQPEAPVASNKAAPDDET